MTRLTTLRDKLGHRYLVNLGATLLFNVVCAVIVTYMIRIGNARLA